ncbi:hypothetical protein GCM10022212_06640 [Actimicrobium antarcticum]|uniref:Uncharacterized protein n=1 Tax=Actimicrobium antarcticum TaxID=1051899 RepID=A0ABP7SPP7_9BURK
MTGCRAAPGLAPRSATRFSYRRPQIARRGDPQSNLTHVGLRSPTYDLPGRTRLGSTERNPF